MDRLTLTPEQQAEVQRIYDVSAYHSSIGAISIIFFWPHGIACEERIVRGSEAISASVRSGHRLAPRSPLL